MFTVYNIIDLNEIFCNQMLPVYNIIDPNEMISNFISHIEIPYTKNNYTANSHSWF